MEDLVVRTWNEKDSLTLTEASLVARQMNTEKVVPLSQIISFEVRDPKGGLRPGMITVQLGGAPSAFVKLTSFLTVGDSGNIKFPHGIDYLATAHKMKDYIMEFQCAKTSGTKSAGPADELQKWKALFDASAITREEYDAKKKQILGL